MCLCFICLHVFSFYVFRWKCTSNEKWKNKEAQIILYGFIVIPLHISSICNSHKWIMQMMKCIAHLVRTHLSWATTTLASREKFLSLKNVQKHLEVRRVSSKLQQRLINSRALDSLNYDTRNLDQRDSRLAHFQQFKLHTPFMDLKSRRLSLIPPLFSP